MQPVSDLQRAQRFDDYDLVANRSGLFSTRQRRRYVLALLAEHALGALVIGFGFALVVNILRLAPDLATIGFVLLIIAAVMLALFVIRVRSTVSQPIRSVYGPVSKYESVLLDGVRLHEIVVGNTTFYVRPEVGQALDDEIAYKMYYLERSPYAGGNLLLSTEAIRGQD